MTDEQLPDAVPVGISEDEFDELADKVEVLEQWAKEREDSPGLVAGLFVAVLIAGITWAITNEPMPLFAPEKHTQVVTVTGGNPNAGFTLKRPNGEVFKMKFDDPQLVLVCGTEFDDITYTDVSRDTRHFVKARLHPFLPTPKENIQERGSGGWIITGNDR